MIKTFIAKITDWGIVTEEPLPPGAARPAGIATPYQITLKGDDDKAYHIHYWYNGSIPPLPAGQFQNDDLRILDKLGMKPDIRYQITAEVDETGEIALTDATTAETVSG